MPSKQKVLQALRKERARIVMSIGHPFTWTAVRMLALQALRRGLAWAASHSMEGHLATALYGLTVYMTVLVRGNSPRGWFKALLACLYVFCMVAEAKHAYADAEFRLPSNTSSLVQSQKAAGIPKTLHTPAQPLGYCPSGKPYGKVPHPNCPAGSLYRTPMSGVRPDEKNATQSTVDNSKGSLVPASSSSSVFQPLWDGLWKTISLLSSQVLGTRASAREGRPFNWRKAVFNHLRKDRNGTRNV